MKNPSIGMLPTGRCIRVVDGPEAVAAAISALGGSERTVFFNK